MKKFGIKDQFGYALGDVGGSFVNLLVDSYFMVFCTYVLGVSPFFMGTLFLFSRLWDAFNDPLIGSLPDRFQIGKSGDRFKPYIKIAMLPLAVACIMCFADVSSWGAAAKHIWICASYIIYGMSYTGTSMPYGSLASVITSDPVERTKLSTARTIGGTVVGLLLAFIPQFIYDKNSNVIPDAFFKVAVVFAICSIAAYIGMVTLSTERVKYEMSGSEYSYIEVLKGVIKNRPLIGAMVATMGSVITTTGSSQFGSYLYKEYYHNAQLLTYVTLAGLLFIFILFPVIPKIVEKFGKRNAILYPTVVSFAVSLVLFLVPIKNVWIYFGLSMIVNIGNAFFTMLVWALVTDCLDYQEYITGKRADGSVYSIFTFARKLGSTLASTIASYALGWIGYVSGAASQTPEVAGRIRYLCTGIPVITGLLIIVGLGFIFNLKKEDSERILIELQEKRDAKKGALS